MTTGSPEPRTRREACEGPGRGSGPARRPVTGPPQTPLRGWRRPLALVWVVAVVALYLAVRELGVGVVP